MENKLVINNVYLEDAYTDYEYYTYFLSLELTDNIIENINRWTEFFEMSRDKKLKVTLEFAEE